MTGYEDIVHAGDGGEGEGGVKEKLDGHKHPRARQYLRQHDEEDGRDLTGGVDLTEDAGNATIEFQSGVELCNCRRKHCRRSRDWLPHICTATLCSNGHNYSLRNLGHDHNVLA